jgi:UDP-2-acetamido-3-amino-2,3-dideoxy-glucuronate N-acetyltransferase
MTNFEARRQSQPSPKFAAVWAGYWGKNHVRNFVDLQALTVVCDNDREKLNLLAKHYPECWIEASYGEVLRDETI